MRICSPPLDAARELVRTEFGLTPAQTVTVRSVPGSNRNRVYQISGPVNGYLKILRGVEPWDGWRRECIALDALQGVVPVPTVISRSRNPGQGVAFLITSAVKGQSLETCLTETPAHQTRAVLRAVANALHKLASGARLPALLEPLCRTTSGPYRPDFSPQRWMERHALGSAYLVRELPAPAPAVLHGSFSTNNILAIDAAGRRSLTALIDFEGCRVGPSGFDEAMLWYDLMLLGRCDLAREWIGALRDDDASMTVADLVVNAAWLSAFRSTGRHPEAKRDAALRPTVLAELDSLLRAA